MKPGEGWKDDNSISIAVKDACGNKTVADIWVEDCRKFGSGKLEQFKGFATLKKKKGEILISFMQNLVLNLYFSPFFDRTKCYY